MVNLDKIAEELFNKIRGRYPKVTLGDETSTITNMPNKARFFDFEFTPGNKVNITVDEKSLSILYNNDLLKDNTIKKEDWYGFMKELRTFAKKRMLNFDTRDITKSNLDKRDYEYMSKNRPGEEQMSESKMYGTSRTSFQDVGNARLVVKHRGAVDQEAPAGRTQQIDSIYIESAEGERFKYPYRHLNGARAMAQHVSEGGNAYDSFGKHIVSLSEELSKLRQFKTYMNRSSVMAEGLAGYMDIVNERIDTVKETIFKLQKPTHYKEAFESFEETVMEEVPEDVSSTWIDELTIRQFNEDLKSVFPYIYNLVKEGMKSKVVGPEDLLGEGYDDSPEGSRDTSDSNPLITNYDDEFKKGEPGLSGQMNLQTWMSIHGISAKYQDQLAKAVLDAGVGKKVEIPDDVKADYDAEYEKEGKPTRKLWIELSQHHEKEVGQEEGLDMESEYASHLDSVVANSKHEQGPEIEEGNEFAQKVRELKAKGAKPGTKFKTSDGEEHTLEDAINKVGMKVEDFWTAEELVSENKLPKSPKVLKLVIDDLEKFKAEQDEAKKQGYDEDVRMMQGRIDDMMDIANLIKDGGPIAALDTSVQDLIVDYYEKAGEPLPFAKEADDDTMDVKIDKDGALSKADAPDDLHDKQEEELPLDEFIKGHFDYTTNQFPKGETAVMTAVEKKYGDNALRDAVGIMKELVNNQDEEMARIKKLAGMNF